MKKSIVNYFKKEDAATGTVETVLLTLGIIAIAGFVMTTIIGALQGMSDKSSCSNNPNDPFCTE